MSREDPELSRLPTAQRAALQHVDETVRSRREAAPARLTRILQSAGARKPRSMRHRRAFIVMLVHYGAPVRRKHRS